MASGHQTIILDEGTAEASVYLGVQARRQPCAVPAGFDVMTSVTRPDGGSVPHQRSALMAAPPWFTGTHVSVRLDGFDSLRLSATFDPGQIVQTATVHVAINRLGGPVVHRLPAAETRDCQDFFTTAHGTVFCQQADGGKFFTDGGVVRRVSSASMAGSGNTIWTYEPPELVRYVDDVPAERVVLPEPPLGLFASADFAIPVLSAVALRYVADAGLLSPTEQWGFDAGTPGAWVTAWDSTNLRIIRFGQECTSVGAAVGALDCHAGPMSSIVAYGPEGFWTWANGRLVLNVASGEATLGPWIPSGYWFQFRSAWGEVPKLCVGVLGFPHLGCVWTLGLARDTTGSWQLAKLVSGDMIEADENWVLVRDNSTGGVAVIRLP